MKSKTQKLQTNNEGEYQKAFYGTIKKSTLQTLQLLGFTKSNSESATKRRNLLMQEEKKVFHEREDILVEGLAAIRQCKADVNSALADTKKLSNEQGYSVSEANLIQINSQDSQIPVPILELLRQLQTIFKEITSEPPIPKFRDTSMIHQNVKIWSEQIEQIKTLTEQLLVATYDFMSAKTTSIRNDVCEISLQASPRRAVWELNHQVYLVLSEVKRHPQTIKPIHFSAEPATKTKLNKTRIWSKDILFLFTLKLLSPLKDNIPLSMLMLNQYLSKNTNYINVSEKNDFTLNEKDNIIKLSCD